ncbi:hypothetical protein GCM10023238_14840 [Streptomyces heliomycini]
MGMLAAGPVAEELSRHWMFALPTIAVIGATLLVNRLMPDDPPGRPDGAGIDWPGLLLLSGRWSRSCSPSRWRPTSPPGPSCSAPSSWRWPPSSPDGWPSNGVRPHR